MRSLLISLLIVNLSCAQGKFSYKDVPDTYIKKTEVTSSFNTLKAKSFEAVKLLPNNYKKDGSEDYTAYIQKAINENVTVLLPNFPILVNDKGLQLKDNTTLLFDDNSQLKLKASNNQGYAIIDITGKKNVSIYNPDIVGDRTVHTGKTGEWGMGINIKDAVNVKVYNPVIKDCWGDGIYIGGNGFSNNISVIGGLIDNNRRNGISVISGDNILLQNLVVSNTNGANPKTGIDIEPNTPDNKKVNISLQSIITFNNEVSGLAFYLARLRGDTNANNVNVVIENFKDFYSKSGISYSNQKNDSKKKLMGNIVFSGIDLKYNKVPFNFLYKNSSLDNINLKVNDFKSDHKDNKGIVTDLQKFSQQKIKYNQ
ncbi:Right handed beta helix region [Chryseobacterium rhizoplanae]|uniref:Right handed beta helix region n=1 Tax=Chryseobacterium rhizoplanae TaxID=1609531 RepID=A0A521EJM9_9FLAO|nr:right-handed parallel beta-helix repeat-containing protein [Chryseobacterium rhizoplanae]SMO83651.1 Right handed beta helix region [Chryseobacterium rhizoplanae]